MQKLQSAAESENSLHKAANASARNAIKAWLQGVLDQGESAQSLVDWPRTHGDVEGAELIRALLGELGHKV